MCYNGKCMHCIEVETGALIFAILNVMYTSIGSVLSMGGLVYTAFLTQAVLNDAGEEDMHARMLVGAVMFGLTGNVLFGILAVCFCIALSFAIVLLVGLCKRKANLVKCYFVYGVVRSVLGVATLMVILINAELFPALLLLFIFAGINALILTMIYNTYRKFQAEVPYATFGNQLSVVEKF